MKYGIVASTWASFSRAVTAAAIGSWLAFATCPTVFAADGAQAAAAAKESAKALSDYTADLARSGRRPDYSNPPIAQYLRRIFDADTLAALPPPQAEDLGWLVDWTESAQSSFKILTMFGVQKDNDINVLIARNMATYENEIAAAVVFMIQVGARVVRTGAIVVNSLPDREGAEIGKTGLEQTRRGLVQTVLGTTLIMSDRLKPQNARLMMAALRDSVAVWRPYLTANERIRILVQLEQARAANADAGIDKDVTAISAVIRQSSN